MSRSFRKRSVLFVAILGSFAFSPTLGAQGLTIDLDPAATKIDFTLSATMHTVHGQFKLKSGRIHFEPSTGNMGGEVIVDATSADTENQSRDAKMHGEVLDSKQFPEIVFTPKLAKGPLVEMLNRQKAVQLQVSGSFRLLGQDHDATIPIFVQPGAAGKMDISTEFLVPYAAWGLKNPSTFVLRVGDTVDLHVHTTGQIAISP